MKVLLTGGAGQLGRALSGALSQLGEVIALDRRGLDLCDTEAITQTIVALRPDAVVNAAAHTAVDQAESERDLAYRVNARAPEIMAHAARKVGSVLVSYSTDYVFDGRGSGAYSENHAARPINVYGQTKLAGEQAIAASGCDHLIFRTSWLYSTEGRNFLMTVIGLARDRSELRVVNDQVGAPTWTRWVAQSTAVVLRDYMSRRGSAAALNGVYHMTAAGETTWFAFASAIVEAVAAREGRASPPVIPITSEEYASPAARPVRSVLSNAKLRRVFGVDQTPWNDQLADCLRDRPRSESCEPR
jgi:dTDP-4-dehydrorhamnose reductase